MIEYFGCPDFSKGQLKEEFKEEAWKMLQEAKNLESFTIYSSFLKFLANLNAADLFLQMLDVNKDTRITVEKALKHPFFKEKGALWYSTLPAMREKEEVPETQFFEQGIDHYETLATDSRDLKYATFNADGCKLIEL